MNDDTAEGPIFEPIAEHIADVLHKPECYCSACVEEWAEGQVEAVVARLGATADTVSEKVLLGSCSAYLARFHFPPYIEAALCRAAARHIRLRDFNPAYPPA